MLDEVQGPVSGVTFGPIAGLIARVQVGSDPDRLVSYPAELRNRSFERPQRVQGGHVADVPGQERAGAVGQTGGVLEFTAHSEHRRPVETDVDRQWRVATRSPDRQLATTVEHADHRVVARHLNGTVVVQYG